MENVGAVTGGWSCRVEDRGVEWCSMGRVLDGLEYIGGSDDLVW